MSTSSSHPALRNTLATVATGFCPVRAAAGLAMSSPRVTSEFPLPEDVGADLIRYRGLDPKVCAAGLEAWLDAGLQSPFPAESEFEACTQIVVAELPQVLGTEPGVEGQEGLTPQLPAGRELGQGLRSTTAGNARADLDQVEGHTEILNQRALQLAGERTGEVRKSRRDNVRLPH